MSYFGASSLATIISIQLCHAFLTQQRKVVVASPGHLSCYIAFDFYQWSIIQNN